MRYECIYAFKDKFGNNHPLGQRINSDIYAGLTHTERRCYIEEYEPKPSHIYPLTPDECFPAEDL